MLGRRQVVAMDKFTRSQPDALKWEVFVTPGIPVVTMETIGLELALFSSGFQMPASWRRRIQSR